MSKEKDGMLSMQGVEGAGGFVAFLFVRSADHQQNSAKLI